MQSLLFSDFLALIFILLVLLLLLFSLVCEAFNRISQFQFLNLIPDKNKLKFEKLLERSDRIYNSALLGRFFIFAVLLIIVFYWLSSSFTDLNSMTLIWGLLIVFGINIFCTNFIAVFYAQRKPEKVLRFFLPLQGCISYIFYPFILIIEGLNKLFSKVVGFKGIPNDQTAVEQTVFDAVHLGKTTGLLSLESEKMIKKVLELKDTCVSEIMTPRTDMISISQDEQITEALKLAHENGHSRIPVYLETRDNIVGILYTRDLLPLLVENKDLNKIELVSIIRKPPTIIPETKNVFQLLNEMRSSKISMAIVVDEYGGTAGIITLEDIIEEIVGEIRDEYDESEEIFDIITIDKGKSVFEADARCRIVDVNEVLNAKIPEEEDFDTLGGYLSFLFGQVPNEGEEIEDDNFQYIIIKADERKINKIRLIRKESQEFPEEIY